LFVPSVISTGLTLLVLWRELLAAKSKKQHIFWGMKFGGIATIFSTRLIILFGILFNYSHGISSGTESLLGLGLVIPGGLVLGTVFIILFSPAIFMAGPVYGLIAMVLKQKSLRDHQLLL
jgi:ABC-type molybdate transport system permease subunit